MSTEANIDGTPKKTTTRKRATKKPAIASENVADLNFNEPNRCSLTGRTEKEEGVLYSIGTVKVGPTALTILNAQHAKHLQDQRGE